MRFITGLGKTNVDLLYADIKRMPNIGEEVYTDNFSVRLGGGLPATLLNLARLNVPVRIGTYLGSDMFSEFAKQEFIKSGAEITNFHQGNTIPVNVTSAVIIDRDRAFISYGEHEDNLTDADKEAFFRLAEGAAICYMENPAFYDVYQQLKNSGTMLVYDTGWDDDMSLKKYDRMLKLADLYTPNRKEAMKLTGASTPQEAATRLTAYFDKVIVKADRDGCFGIENGELFRIPEITEFVCKDATGAGDAFLAGLLYGIFNGYSFRESILLGNLTGGKAVTDIGALSACFTEQELLNYFHRYHYLCK